MIKLKNILILDDHMVIRVGLKGLLEDFYRGLHIFEAEDGDSYLEIMKRYKIDLAILDLQIPDTNTINLIEVTRIKYPDTYMMVFSMLPEKIYGQRVLNAGASGFLPKDAPMSEIRRALDNALNNKKYISPGMHDSLERTSVENSMNPFQKLSFREFEIANLFIGGSNITQIATRLNIKPSTVGTYKTRIFEKLKISSGFELKEIATVYGIVNHLGTVSSN